MDIKYFLILATYVGLSTASAETDSEHLPGSEMTAHDASHIDVHQDTPPPHEDAPPHDPDHPKTNDEHKNEDEDEDEDTDDDEDQDEDTSKEEHACGPSSPSVPKEEPPSKKLQQEAALIELNAYFDNYMCPRPFTISSTEF